MSQSEYPYKRRHFFIKKEFQFKFIIKFCLLILLGTFISTGLLLIFSHGTLTTSFQHSRLVVTDTSSAILSAVVYTNLITLGLITLFTIIVVLLISHKIAGPLYRFEKELKEIGEGNLTRVINLRTKDQMTDIAKCLTEMVASLHEKIKGMQNEVEDVIKSASEKNAPKDLIEELRHLNQTIINSFKI